MITTKDIKKHITGGQLFEIFRGAPNTVNSALSIDNEDGIAQYPLIFAAKHGYTMPL